MELSAIDRLRVYEIIEYRHISAREKKKLLAEIAAIQRSVKESTSTLATTDDNKGASSGDSTTLVLGSLAVTALGFVTFQLVSKFTD